MTSTLMTIVLICVCWMSFVTITGALVFDFDCRRLGVDCGQGECSMSNGQCDCSKAPFTQTNYKCQEETESSCSHSTYGENCALKRVQVDCTGNDMFVNIHPDGSFTGSIYVFGKETVPECQLQNPAEAPEVPDYVKNREKIEGLRLALSYDDETCGEIEKTEDDNNGTKKTTYTRSYFIQYNKNFRSNLDQKVTVNCVLLEGATKVVGEVNDIQEGNGKFKDVNVDVDADTGVVKFAIKNKDDQLVQSDVTLGDEIKLVFDMIPGRGYSDFTLTECTATNTFNESDSGFLSVTIVRNDCPSSEAQAIFQNGVIKASDPTSITVSISAFMFSGTTSKVGFACDVTLCREDNKENCKKEQCDGITSEADKQRVPEVSSTTTSGDSNIVTPEEGTGNGTSSANDTDTVTPDNGSDNDDNSTESVTPETPDNDNDNNTSPGNNTVDNSTSAADDTTDDTNDPTDTNNNIATEENTPGENATTPEVDTSNNGGGEDPDAETTAASLGPSDENEGGETEPATRRRRAAGDEDTPVKRVYSDMTVRDPNAIVEEPATPLPMEKECLEEPEVITVIAILSVIVVTLTLVTLVAICHMIRGGRHKKSFEDEHSSKDSELRTTVEPAQHTFNIPRLEIRAKRPMPYTTT